MKMPDGLRKAGKAVKRFLTNQQTLDYRVAQAAEENDIDALRRALDAGGKAEQTSYSMPKPIKSAVKNKNQEMAALLIDSGAKVNAWLGYDGGTPLTAATKQGDAGMVTLLLEKGADIESEAPGGYTPFLLAVKNRNKEIMKTLWDQGADVDVVMNKGWSALFFAAAQGDTALITDLLDAGARTYLRDEKGQSVLDVARAYEKFAACDLIQKHIDDQVKPWQVTGDQEIAHVTIQRKAGYRLTEVFNFETRHVTTVSHNYATGRDSLFVQAFDEMTSKDAIALATAKLAAEKPTEKPVKKPAEKATEKPVSGPENKIAAEKKPETAIPAAPKPAT